MSSKASDDNNITLYRTYHFNIGEDFSQKLVTTFFDMINSIGYNDRLEIFLSSCGGDVSAIFSILRIINANPDRFTLVVSGSCDSATLFMILLSDCEKVFLPSFIGGVLHSISMKVHTRELDNLDADTSPRYKAYKKLTHNILKFISLMGVDDTIIEDVKNGKDVFLSREQLIKCIKIKENNNLIFKLN